jgi:heme/copper-type cytochrome/quinol oxidase subunit 2
LSGELLRLFVVIALLSLSLAACSAPEGPREIAIVARGMTFMLPSDPDTPNPVIRVRPGEHITLTLLNDAPGLMHDFRIPAWHVKTDQIRGGESTTVSFAVPSEVGRYEYTCGPHSTMMQGFIEVTAK